MGEIIKANDSARYEELTVVAIDGGNHPLNIVFIMDFVGFWCFSFGCLVKRERNFHAYFEAADILAELVVDRNSRCVREIALAVDIDTAEAGYEAGLNNDGWGRGASRRVGCGRNR